jgi:polyhydroxybutyrate depolymerase
MAAWATRNGCTDADPEEVFVADDVARLAWDCPVSGGTVLYRIEGGGHTWPGSEFGARIVDMVGATTPNLSANQMMWQFFLLHPLGAD